MSNLKRGFLRPLALLVALLFVSGAVFAKDVRGLSEQAFDELAAAGMNKYLGQFSPSSTEQLDDGWVKHSFDSQAGDGPICITGSNYSVFTRLGRNPNRVLVFLQGGGACWQGLYSCNPVVETQEPPLSGEGIWDLKDKNNPFRGYSVVYLPYCDGSVFTGDNDVVDPEFPFGPVRFHRGLRNLSAGLDVAKQVFPNPKRVTLAGASAGGVGAAAFAPLLSRFVYGNKLRRLTVLNDSGPIVLNPLAASAAAARAADWRFDQFYPASCAECDGLGQGTALIKWRLDNDSRVREVFYDTDGDSTNIGFASANAPGFPPLIPFDPANGVFGLNQVQYRELILLEHGKIKAAHPLRYKRFIVSGEDSHTALQSPLFYSQEANGVKLSDWTADFLKNKKGWKDIVEEFIALP